MRDIDLSSRFRGTMSQLITRDSARDQERVDRALTSDGRVIASQLDGPLPANATAVVQGSSVTAQPIAGISQRTYLLGVLEDLGAAILRRMRVRTVDSTVDGMPIETLVMPNGSLVVAGSVATVTFPDAMVNPMTTPADIIVGGTAGAPMRLGKGAPGQVLTVDPTTGLLVYANPATGGATATELYRERRYGQISITLNQGGALQWVGFNSTFGAITGGATGFADAFADWTRYQSAATIGSAAGIYAQPGGWGSRHNPSTAIYAHPDTTADVRLWVGFTSGDPIASATPSLRIAAFRYDSAVDGTAFWRCVTADGTTTQQVTVTTVPVATSNPPVLRVDLTATEAKFYADNVLMATHATVVPSSSIALGVAARLTTLVAVAKNLYFNRIGLVVD